jgi:hypothetical protein
MLANLVRVTAGHVGHHTGTGNNRQGPVKTDRNWQVHPIHHTTDNSSSTHKIVPQYAKGNHTPLKDTIE